MSDNKTAKKNKNSINLDTIAFQIRESYKTARTNLVYSVIKKGCLILPIYMIIIYVLQ